MTMKAWAERLDRILTMSGKELLQGNGSVSHQQAVDKAKDEYINYKARTVSNVEEDYLNSIRLLEIYFQYLLCLSVLNKRFCRPLNYHLAMRTKNGKFKKIRKYLDLILTTRFTM